MSGLPPEAPTAGDPADAGGLGLSEVGPASYYGNPRAEVLKLLPAGIRRLLDVGCANGAFGALVKARTGATVWGIEIKEEVARIAAGRLDRVITADALQGIAAVPEGWFECVTFNDVLEHLVDPAAVLGAVKRSLAPGGVIVASIPNLRHYPVLVDLLLRGNWDYVSAGVLDRTHLRFFTQRSIRKLFSGLGYRLLRMEGINAPTSPRGRLLCRLLPPALTDVQYMQFVCVAQPVDLPAAAGSAGRAP